MQYEPTNIVKAKINGKSRIAIIKKVLKNLEIIYADLMHPDKNEDPKVQFNPESVEEQLYIPSLNKLYTKTPVRLIAYKSFGSYPVSLFELLSEIESHKQFVVNVNDGCWEANTLVDAMEIFRRVSEGNSPILKQDNSWLLSNSC